LSTQRAIVRRRDVESRGDGQTRPRTGEASTGGWDAVDIVIIITARHHDDARCGVDESIVRRRPSSSVVVRRRPTRPRARVVDCGCRARRSSHVDARSSSSPHRAVMSASTLARASATMRANSMASTRRGKTRRGDACVRRARITSKEPWWDKNTAENMIDCDGVDAFLTLLVRVVDVNRVVRRQTRRRDGWRG
jgi:hypothetical protein